MCAMTALPASVSPKENHNLQTFQTQHFKKQNKKNPFKQSTISQISPFSYSAGVDLVFLCCVSFILDTAPATTQVAMLAGRANIPLALSL